MGTGASGMERSMIASWLAFVVGCLIFLDLEVKAFSAFRAPVHVAIRSRSSDFLASSKACRVGGSKLCVANFVSSKTDPEVSDNDDERGPKKGKDKKDTPKITAVPLNAEASRFRKLKDIMWVRETLEDLTAAEFACTVESQDVGGDAKRRRKRAVDYEKLLVKLNDRVVDMVGPYKDTADAKVGDLLTAGKGMGRFVYDEKGRLDLLSRVVDTRQLLLKAIKDNDLEIEAESEEPSFPLPLPEIPEIKVEIPKEGPSLSASGPKLYVREDGTVDWDGALQDREALQKFGRAVWQRINGRTPGDFDEVEKSGHEGKKASVTAKIPDTPATISAKAELRKLSDQYKEMQVAHTKLLTTGIQAGQAVANVKMASLDPGLRNRIRESADALEAMEQKVSFQTLVYELERLYTYFASELGNPDTTGYVPLQDRLNVAEFGLLESQLESFQQELERTGAIDEDVLAVVMEQLTDFKRRLGIDYYVTGLSFDREAILLWLSDILRQFKNGIGFYVKGCQLFIDDILYSSGLIARAAQGYILKPREVRTIRRTFKDIITFVPVVIILIIPLTPVGHVLVFGAIQRFFPDFFPSCFTEQRQNLLKLYETTEYSEFTINETWQEKVVRVMEAAVFFSLNQSKQLYQRLMGMEVEEDGNDAQDDKGRSNTKKR